MEMGGSMLLSFSKHSRPQQYIIAPPTPSPMLSCLLRPTQTLLQALEKNSEGTRAFTSHYFPRERTCSYLGSNSLGLHLPPF